MENIVDQHIDNLIVDQLNGDIDKLGRKELEAWIDSSPEHKKYYFSRQEVWFSLMPDDTKAEFSWSEGFERFKKKVDKELTKQEDFSNSAHRFYFLRYVAIVAIAVVTGYVLYNRGEESVKHELANINMEVPLGSQMNMLLPDGTKVCLNGGSEISYSQGFGVNNRDITLEGEGYFEVKHNARLPLMIKTKNIELTDLGTKFDVCDYREDDEAHVVVDEGCIQIESGKTKRTAILRSNQRVAVDKNTGNFNLASMSQSEKENRWNNGLLNFYNLPMWEIAKDLSRAYGVEIMIKNSKVGNTKYCGLFSCKNQDLNDILRILSATGTLKYKIAGKHVDIY